MEQNVHYLKSSYREMLLEHLFIGEMLKALWLRGVHDVEVLKPQVDDSGYDIVVSCQGVMRYIQLKSSKLDARANRKNLNLSLAVKPGGCIVWIRFDPETMAIGPFLFFGGEVGGAFPDISELKVARHVKGDSTGYKAEQPNIRILNKGNFTPIDSIEALNEQLFGVPAELDKDEGDL